MKKYHIKLDITLYADSEEAALKLAIPLAKVEEINPTSEGGAGGGGGINTARSGGGSGGCTSTKAKLVDGIAGGWRFKYEMDTPIPIIEISGGGGKNAKKPKT